MQNKKSANKWIWENCKKFVPAIFALVILGILISLISVVFAVVSKSLIDVATGQIGGSIIYYSLAILILVAMQLFVQSAYAVIDVKVAGKISMSIKNKLFGEVFLKKWGDITKYHSGDILNRITSDATVVANAVVTIIPNAVSFIASIVFAMIVLFSLDRTFAVMCLIAGPIIAVFVRLYSKKIKNLHKRCQESEGKTRSLMQECLQNILIIKSFGNEDMIKDDVNALQMKNYRLNVKRGYISVIMSIIFYLGMSAGYYFALGYGAFKIYNGVMSFGTLTAMLQLVGKVQQPFKELSSIVPQYYSMIASAERIIEIIDLPDERYSIQTKDMNYVYDNMEALVAEDITFSYDGGDGKREFVFKNASLDIKKRDFACLCGQSGIGKSTFLKLILGIIEPDFGKLYILMKDGTKLPINQETRALFAYVPQGNMILSGTIRENIAFSTSDIDDDRVEECAKIAAVYDFISGLPDGFETKIGENALGLSEGQTQRLAVARAIYHGAPILLFDEATSALDDDTENALLANMMALKSKTCIIVSHKDAPKKICNKNIKIQDERFSFV